MYVCCTRLQCCWFVVSLFRFVALLSSRFLFFVVLLLCCVGGLPSLRCCCFVDLLVHVFVCVSCFVCLHV